jgi:germination protein M
MKRLALVLILIAMGLGAVVLLRDAIKRPEGPDETATPVSVKAVTLYFGSQDGSSLVAESHEIKAGGDVLGDLRVVLGALLAGPTGEATALFPHEATVRAVYIRDRTAYVDFSREIVDGFTGGSAGEYLLVASLVQTVCANFPEVDAVRILVEGDEIDTIGGHLDISRPLRPNDWR